MFDKMKDMMGQFQLFQKLMKNENFRTFIAHPKIQELFRDPEFQEVIKTKDTTKILSHPKLASLMREPEIARLAAKLKPQDFS